MKFKDKITIVTGATKGIGKEIARLFAEEGATVILVGRNEEQLKKTTEEIKKKGGKAEAVVCDVTIFKNVQEIVNKILDKYKRVDILINNAGITKDNLIFRMSEQDFDDVLRVNLKGVFNCTKIIVKAMLKEKHGKIVNIASITGLIGNSGQANYAASKAGVIGFTKTVAQEVASRGITVNAVAPGYIQTDMTAQLSDKSRDNILQSIPIGEFGTPRDVAAACMFLASDDADYITGQTIVVDGGMAI